MEGVQKGIAEQTKATVFVELGLPLDLAAHFVFITCSASLRGDFFGAKHDFGRLEEVADAVF